MVASMSLARRRLRFKHHSEGTGNFGLWISSARQGVFTLFAGSSRHLYVQFASPGSRPLLSGLKLLYEGRSFQLYRVILPRLLPRCSAICCCRRRANRVIQAASESGEFRMIWNVGTWIRASCDAISRFLRSAVTGKFQRLIVSNGGSRSSPVGPILLAGLSILFMFFLHPRLGIRDFDAYAYIMGALSLHRGLGYRGLTGEAFNTYWPPGYSLLLSPFHDPASAALVFNYLSYGAAVGLLSYLARRLGWTWQAGLGFSVILASGFFRLLASSAHADMVTYALFFAAICFAIGGTARALPGLIWAFLIPVKLIAIIFVPPSIVADWTTTPTDWKRLFRSYAHAGIATAMSVGGILAFNFYTTKTWTGGHPGTSLTVLVSGSLHFMASVPREFFFSWYGTIFTPLRMSAFVVCMTLAVICLISLRPTKEGNWFRMYGAAFLVCAVLLLCVHSFDPQARLLGYGLIMLMLGFRPMEWANKVWIFYGLVSLIIGIINAVTANSLGSNDPRYAALAAEVGAYHPGPDVIATNSFHILDLFAKIPSIPVASYAEAEAYKKFFWSRYHISMPLPALYGRCLAPKRDGARNENFLEVCSLRDASELYRTEANSDGPRS